MGRFCGATPASRGTKAATSRRATSITAPPMSQILTWSLNGPFLPLACFQKGVEMPLALTRYRWSPAKTPSNMGASATCTA